jgi:DNA-binding NarL/FixJ family response regulator
MSNGAGGHENGIPSERKYRVLIVDDQPDMRVLVNARLSMMPSVEIVGEARDGAQAVAMSEQLKPDAVVLDLSMPVLSGADAIPRIREVSPKTRILVYSAVIDHFDLRGESQPDGAVRKGADLDELALGLLSVLA